MINIFILNSTIFSQNNYFSKFYKRLSTERQRSINECRSQKDKFLSLGAGTLLDFGLRKYNLRENEVEFSYNKFGKPFIKNNNCSIYFNLSHSGKYVVCVFSEFEIGVDIQEVVHVNLNLASHFLPKSCINHIYTQKDNNHQIKEFHRIWTIYESYIKMLGNNLIYPFFDIDLESIIESHSLKVNNAIFYFHELSIQNNDYLISICTADSQLNEIVYLDSKYLNNI